jgi:tetratricopeptide (TPR) repeat protein
MDKKFTLLLYLLAVVVSVSFGQGTEIRKSKRLIDVDHAAEAMAPIEAAIKQYPKDADLYYYLGYAQLKNGQYDAAGKSFDAGISKNAKEAINYAGKGHLSMLLNRPDDAKVDLKKALDISKSKKVPVLKAVAEAYLTNPKFVTNAITLLLRAKSIRNDAEIELLLGNAYVQQREGGPAVSAYERAAAMDPKNGKPHYQIGLVYVRVNPALSQQSFEKAVAVDPEFTYAYEELADIYYQQKQADKAVIAAEKFRQLSSDPEKIKMRLAFIYVMQGEYAKANPIFAELVRSNTVKPVLYRYYIKSLQATQLPADSMESAKVSEQFLMNVLPEDLTPKDFIDLATLYSAMGNDSLGEVQLANAIRFDPESVEAAQALAELLYKNKKYEEAAAAYERLVSIKPNPSPNEYLSMARAYSISEQFLNADSIYTRLVEQYPTNIQVAVEAARVKANIDSTQELGLAKPLYEKILALGAADIEKNKFYIIEANKYLGAYYAITEGNLKKGKAYFEEVLKLNPKDAQAIEVIEAIEQGTIQTNKAGR